mmetsp:Transcript_8460/g.17110  ORF Transcript_8460/g.17110 Transcript_8460/m.17110 type:complete len:210 (-) Transcript_8460:1906-2535(-)
MPPPAVSDVPAATKTDPDAEARASPDAITTDPESPAEAAPDETRTEPVTEESEVTMDNIPDSAIGAAPLLTVMSPPRNAPTPPAKVTPPPTAEDDTPPFNETSPALLVEEDPDEAEMCPPDENDEDPTESTTSPEEEAGSVEIITDPEALPAPEVTDTSPPDPELSVVSPPLILTVPPSPMEPLPTLSKICPAAEVEESPVWILTCPEG